MTDTNNQELEKPKKKGRPKGSKNNIKAPKTPEAAARQAATQFKKGDVNNPGGARSFRKPTLEFRQKCHQIIFDHGLSMMINLLYDAYETKKTEEALDIIKWLGSMAYGNPKPMETYPEEDDLTNRTSHTVSPIMVIDRESMLNAVKNDGNYN